MGSEKEKLADIVPIQRHVRWTPPPAAPLEQPTNVPEPSQERYPHAFGRVLRLHMTQNAQDADNAYLPLRQRNRGSGPRWWSVVLMVAGIGLAVHAVYSIIY